MISCDEQRIAYVTKLLRRAIDSGEKGVRESDLSSARMYASITVRAYESAIKGSLGISLTRRHCATIDQSSYQIELLLPRLEQRIVELREQRTSELARYAPRSADFGPTVRLFLDHCARVRNTALKMRKRNAELI